MSGEDIREEIKKRRGTKPSPGTIYPVLKALSSSGLIEEVKDSGKEKRYALTNIGKKELTISTRKFCEIFYDMRDELRRFHD